MSGNVFVVLSPLGFWDGQGWVPDWEAALHFRGAGDPGGECEALADELRGRLSLACNVAYVPRTQVAGGQVPGGKARG